MIDGKLTPSSILNIAMRDWLGDNGYSTNCYLDVAEEDDAAA